LTFTQVNDLPDPQVDIFEAVDRRLGGQRLDLVIIVGAAAGAAPRRSPCSPR
jgi:inactivated superfamily I helicase